MAIYEMSSDEIRSVPTTTFAEARVLERQHLQRFLRSSIEIVAPGTMVLAEEFGEWEGSSRRIDLLALDKQANLVVVELKRDQDGGHMELQALRYAAMVSPMTFARAVDAHQSYLAGLGHEGDARSAILQHLGWSEPHEDGFAQDVRMRTKLPDRSFEALRWFLEDDELFHDATSTFALSNQWTGADVLAAIAAIAERYPELRISYEPTASVG